MAVRGAIAARARGALAEKCKTQRQLGEVLGIPQSSVALRLKGVTPFRAEELAAMADFLDVPVERFMPMANAPAASAA